MKKFVKDSTFGLISLSCALLAYISGDLLGLLFFSLMGIFFSFGGIIEDKGKYKMISVLSLILYFLFLYGMVMSIRK